MLNAYSKFLDGIGKVVKALTAVMFMVMIVTMIYQVVMRYVFNHSTVWAEELSRYMFIYIVLLGAGLATRYQQHLQIDVFLNMLKPRVRHIATIAATVVGMIFLWFMLVYSIELCMGTTHSTSAGLKISMPYIYGCIPLGTVFMLLSSVEVIAKHVIEFRKAGKNGEKKEVGTV